MLILAHAARPGSVAAATVDHGLRAESGAEAKLVAQHCAALCIPHQTLAVAVERTGNLQAAARAARYAALAPWAEQRGLRAIATGHQRDDQAETLLMRLARGSGVRGLAGMRPRAPLPGAPAIMLLRPLLGWARADLAKLIEATGLQAIADPSNADQRFERVAIRERLAAAAWLAPDRLAATASHLADADEALAWAAGREFAERVEAIEGGYDYRPLAPRAVRLRVIERLVATCGSAGQPRGPELARLLDSLEQGRVATLGGTRCQPFSDRRWRFKAAPPRRG